MNLIPEVVRTRLCVGGPWAGKKYEAPRGQTEFQIAVTQPLPVQAYDQDQFNSMTTVITHVVYKEVRFRAGEDYVVTFWAPTNQSLKETMLLLLEAYQAGKVVKGFQK